VNAIAGAKLVGMPLSALALFAASLLASDVVDRPNVILILTDDQGASDLGVLGADDLRTPALDRLAERGVLFTSFYSAAPVCSPSRAAILTGRSPQAAGVPGNVSPVLGSGSGLPAAQVTLAEALAGSGYRTALVGKWHLGHDPGLTPDGQGFERWFGHLVGCIDNWSHFFFWQGPNRHDLYRDGVEVFRDGEYFPDLMLEEARDFIRADDERPFFLYFASNAPHYPYQGDADRLATYRQRGVAHPRDLYGAFLESLDARVGALLDELEASGIADETLVIFQSDHGHSTEVRAHGGGGSAGGLRGAKFSLFEGGVRVPAIASWPGRFAQGVRRAQLASSTDWFPTILEACGVAPVEHALTGRSLLEVIADVDAPSPHGALHWESGGQWAVREGRWKLIRDPYDTSSDEHQRLEGLHLFDLEADPGERRNLAAERADLVERLAGLHRAWVAAGY
jgi:arylsulfatase A